ncbi:hypothetical protein P692DRAFT_201842408 [Suillus brevipes Sb2]|nr:hypothetical protein P692DRAFT_201842408 [Suillus brevipes Sb2]
MPTLSTLTLPNPGTKAAPAKFKGGFSEVKGFLKHYEKLCDYNKVVSDSDKCESITQYIKLKSDILKYYDADLDTKRYRRKDLITFVKSSRDKKIPNLTAWKKYQANKLTNEEYVSYFWEGIYKLRTKIESHRDLSQAFPVDKLLHCDRFDADLLVSEVDSDTDTDSSTEETSDDSSDSESSESEQEFFLKKHKAKKATKKVVSHKETKGNKPKNLKRAPKKVENNTSLEPMDEMEGLIKKMSSISIEDPDYALLYYRATKIDPDIKDLVAAPAKKRSGNNVYSQTNPETDSISLLTHPTKSNHAMDVVRKDIVPSTVSA